MAATPPVIHDLVTPAPLLFIAKPPLAKTSDSTPSTSALPSSIASDPSLVQDENIVELTTKIISPEGEIVKPILTKGAPGGSIRYWLQDEKTKIIMGDILIQSKERGICIVGMKNYGEGTDKRFDHVGAALIELALRLYKPSIITVEASVGVHGFYFKQGFRVSNFADGRPYLYAKYWRNWLQTLCEKYDGGHIKVLETYRNAKARGSINSDEILSLKDDYYLKLCKRLASRKTNLPLSEIEKLNFLDMMKLVPEMVDEAPFEMVDVNTVIAEELSHTKRIRLDSSMMMELEGMELRNALDRFKIHPKIGSEKESTKVDSDRSPEHMPYAAAAAAPAAPATTLGGAAASAARKPA